MGQFTLTLFVKECAKRKEKTIMFHFIGSRGVSFSNQFPAASFSLVKLFHFCVREQKVGFGINDS